jgi:hypothetical protein
MRRSDGKPIISQGDGSKSVIEQIKVSLDRPGTRIGVAKLSGSRLTEGLVLELPVISSPRYRGSILPMKNN